MRKKKSGKKKIIITTITLILLWLLGFYLYVTYNNIEIYDSNYTTQKTQSTIEEQTVEKAEEESKKVADIIVGPEEIRIKIRLHMGIKMQAQVCGNLVLIGINHIG